MVHDKGQLPDIREGRIHPLGPKQTGQVEGENETNR